MIDPGTAYLAASAVSAGTSLLGGYVSGKDANKNHKKQVERMRNQQIMLQRQLDTDRPGWIRNGAEQAGFNPLVFAGPSGLAGNLASPAITDNPMGEAIARAGAAVADGFGNVADLDMKKAELEMEQQRLELLREEIKLKPTVPGIYGTGSIRGVGGGIANAATSPVLSGGDLTGTPTPIIPTSGANLTYDSTNRPYEVSPGMNLPMTHTETLDVGGVPLTFTLPGAEEMEGLDESANRLLWGLPQMPYQFFKRGGELSGKRMEDAWADRRANPEKYREPVPRVDLMSDEELARALRGE